MTTHTPTPMEARPFAATHDEWVREANRIAASTAQDYEIRALGAHIVRELRDVRRDGPLAIAEWVRANIIYTQEAPGLEVIQGPHHTLPWWMQLGPIRFRGAGTGDCDDLATTWAALCRSVGLNAHVAGLRTSGSRAFYHAVGYCDGQWYELSRDETYGGIPRGPVMHGLPDRTVAYVYDPIAMRGYTMGEGRRPTVRSLAALGIVGTAVYLLHELSR